MAAIIPEDAGMPGVAKPHVVIVGGGFAGLNAARVLARREARVTLVDRRNHHLFQPLLYQVATAGLSPADIATPLRSILRKASDVRVILAAAERVEPEARRVILDEGELTYDALILAAGATHSYFGHDEWETLAPGLKTLEDALEIRRRVLLAFEAAERARDAAERRALLTLVVIGGGPTGVELAGAPGQLARPTLAPGLPAIEPTPTRGLLPHGRAPIPSSLSRRLARAAARRLP